MRVAVVQLEPSIADVAENLRRCRALGDEAGEAGAEWIVLPEFFSTGMGFDDRMAAAACPPDGAPMQLLQDLARRHHATVGGSFVCRDADGHNRNAFFLVGPDGQVLGRHDKDLPTMWENCFYAPGDDDGVIDADGLPVGAALCWEFMRTQTVHRLAGRVDLVVGGSAWWSIPEWPPASVTRRLEAANQRTAAGIAPAMARAVGAPVAHAAQCGPVECGLPLVPGVPYRGRFQGGACVTDGAGGVLAWRGTEDGPGIVVADVEPGRRAPTLAVDDGFWLHPRGAVAAALWGYQNPHGRRWYRRHALGAPVESRSLEALIGPGAPVPVA
ncbi:MAG: carbon-nitrogen hydrolase family protein [Solirubrobacteraceae bacterium]